MKWNKHEKWNKPIKRRRVPCKFYAWMEILTDLKYQQIEISIVRVNCQEYWQKELGLCGATMLFQALTSMTLLSFISIWLWKTDKTQNFCMCTFVYNLMFVFLKYKNWKVKNILLLSGSKHSIWYPYRRPFFLNVKDLGLLFT